MDNLQYDLLIEDIFKTIGKFQDDGTYAIRRDIMNRLNQCIPVAFIEHLSDFLNERGYEGDDTSIRLSDFRHVFTEWMASVNSDEMNRSLSSMDSESFPQIVDRFVTQVGTVILTLIISHTSLSNSSDSFNSADVFADADFVKPMPVPLQVRGFHKKTQSNLLNLAREKRQFWRRRHQGLCNRVTWLALGVGV